MLQSGSRFHKLLATLMPLLLVWVSVACLTICLSCDAEADELCAVACVGESLAVAEECCEAEENCAEESRAVEHGDVTDVPEVIVQSFADTGLCPIPPPPAAALQKSYSYAASTSDETSSRPLFDDLSGKSLLRVADSPSARCVAFSATLKPPLKQLSVLRI